MAQLPLMDQERGGVQFRAAEPQAGSIWTSYIQAAAAEQPSSEPPKKPKPRRPKRHRIPRGAALPPREIPIWSMPDVVLQTIVQAMLQSEKWPTMAVRAALVSPQWHHCMQLALRTTAQLSHLPKDASLLLPQLLNLVDLQLGAHDPRNPTDLDLLAKHCLRLRRLGITCRPDRGFAAFPFESANVLAPACGLLLSRLESLQLNFIDKRVSVQQSEAVYQHLSVMELNCWNPPNQQAAATTPLAVVVLCGLRILPAAILSLAQCVQLHTVMLTVSNSEQRETVLLHLARHCPRLQVVALHGALVTQEALAALNASRIRVLVGCSWILVLPQSLHPWLQQASSLEALALHGMQLPRYEDVSRIVAASPLLRYLAIPCPNQMAAMALLRLGQLRALVCLALTQVCLARDLSTLALTRVCPVDASCDSCFRQLVAQDWLGTTECRLCRGWQCGAGRLE